MIFPPGEGAGCFWVAESMEHVRKNVPVNLICIAKISVTSPIVINMPARELLAGETKNSFV